MKKLRRKGTFKTAELVRGSLNAGWYAICALLKTTVRPRGLESVKNIFIMCNCRNVEFGTYEVAIPVWCDRKKKVVQIDLCIALEVVQLWGKGIDTLESCCGHNKSAGYIAVNDCDIAKMLYLGYIAIAKNKGCFIPKNIFNSNRRD